eukprot:gene4350-1311_t
MRETPSVNVDGEYTIKGSAGKLAMFVDALTHRDVYACGIAEHRLLGDVIEQ